MSRCAGVREAAVVARSRNPDGEPDSLVAHVVLADDAERTPLELRRDLAARLPHYMLPSAFVFLDAMPLTSTGKTDRRALEALELPPPTRPRSIEPPRDDLERAVASIFEHMLAVSPVGRGDDFFLLGGDSLALAELQTRLRDTCGATLPGLVEDSTVAGIAASIRRSRATAPATRAMPVLLPLRESGSATPLFLVHGRHGPRNGQPQVPEPARRRPARLGIPGPRARRAARAAGLGRGDGARLPRRDARAPGDGTVFPGRALRRLVRRGRVGARIARRRRNGAAAAAHRSAAPAILDPRRVHDRPRGAEAPAGVQGRRARSTSRSTTRSMRVPRSARRSRSSARSRATVRARTTGPCSCCRAGSARSA